MLYKQVYIPVIWNSVSLAFYGNTQTDFGRMVMRGSRKFCQRGSKFDNVFCCFFCLFFHLVDEGIEDQNTAINGPSSARQRNVIEMAFRWRADDGPTLNAGLVAL